MNVLGFDVTEWLAVVSIISLAISAIIWLVNNLITKPTDYRNEMLNDNIKGLTSQLEQFTAEMKADRKAIYKKLDEHDRRLDHHDRRLGRHHERMKQIGGGKL